MTERTPKSPRRRFFTGMLVYAAVFLSVTAVGLLWFRDYISAYEQSRPDTAMEAYMEGVDADYLCDGGAAAVIAAVDPRIQSEEDCRACIRSALNGELRYVSGMSASADGAMVYTVLCGENAVCTVTLTQQSAGRYGFARWEVASETFDLSHIRTSTASVTVPQDFAVRIGSALLDEGDIIAEELLFPELEAYGDGVPRLVTYRSGAFLGELPFVLTDGQGRPVTLEADTDLLDFMDNCTAEQAARMDSLADVYIRRYVDLLSCTGNDRYKNYWNLAEYLVQGSALDERFRAALDGLYWVSDRRSSVTDLTVDHRVDLGGGRYLCTVTYGVDTHLFSGLSHEITSARLILAETAAGLKVENMTIQ